MKFPLTKIKKVLYIIALFIFIIPGTGNSAMKSTNYIIYENILHSFDGPIISNVSSSLSDNDLTVTWITNAPSDSFVVYDVINPFTSRKEQGNTNVSVTSHSVIVSGLDYSTTYYFSVKSKRINGGTTLDSTVYSVSVGADPTPSAEQPSTGGGGILIIDKTDKFPPEIDNVSVTQLGDLFVNITWETDEEATSFVEYGLNDIYGNVYGEWSSSTDHSVVIENLFPGTVYNFRALSSDDWGNVGYSDNFTFTTLELGEEPVDEPGVEPKSDEPFCGDGTIDDNEECDDGNTDDGDGCSARCIDEPQTDEALLEEASRKALEIFNRLSNQVSLNFFEDTLIDHINSIEELAGVIPAPLLSGEPRLDIEADNAEVSWTTDKDSNSLVAIAPDDEYDADADESYVQVVGNADELTTQHSVKILGLRPDTLYHFQLRSQASVGPMGISSDFTFRTQLENLEMISFFAQVLDDFSATIKWVTNKETDSQITFIPYRGNILSLEEAKTAKDSDPTIIHEIKIEDFMPGIFYDIEIISRDDEGNSVTETIERFSTSEDDFPPEISQIKSESSIFIDKSDKVQTVITWLTNEPSTSMVYHMRGVQRNKELENKTKLIKNYTKEHVVVIPSFKPGQVYSFMVESTDSGDNTSISKLHTFMTPKKSESIIQVIIKILEDTFGWVKKIVR